MTAYRSALPRYSSFDGLRNAAEAAGLAFMPAETEDSATRLGARRPAIMTIAGLALAIAAATALVLMLILA